MLVYTDLRLHTIIAGVKAVATWFYEHLHCSIPIIALQSQYEEPPMADGSFVINQLQNLSVADSITTEVSNLKVAI